MRLPLVQVLRRLASAISESLSGELSMTAATRLAELLPRLAGALLGAHPCRCVILATNNNRGAILQLEPRGLAAIIGE